MDDGSRRIIADALPRLRGHFLGGDQVPLVSWKVEPRAAALSVSLSEVARSGAGTMSLDLPVRLGDPELGIEVSVMAYPPKTAERPLAGKVVAVTGAGNGIGREIARVFTEAGAKVAALDINQDALEVLRQELGCVTISCDVTSERDVARAFDSVVLECSGLDILVTNAGSASQGPIADVPLAELQRSFDLNFYGHQRSCQAAVKIFRAQNRGGVILFNISNQSVNPGKHFGPYGIPKAAALALMKQYAVDHSREGIRVSGVNAGRIRTGLLTDDMIQQRARARGISTDQYMAGNLLGVEVTARDVAGAFLHLALMDKVNAAVLTVDAGDMATSMR